MQLQVDEVFSAYHTSRSLPNGPQTLKRISSLVFNICAFSYLNIDLQRDVKLLVIYPIKNDMSQFVPRLRPRKSQSNVL